ncbi:hypothetical protein QCA50_005589 [Cerrena zonata]|uniref:BTB domain-containing protein n=1 Tax=Cerrena zonata TaxID=2478898 RepID=A0AAW0GC52_9APHY
MDVNISRSTAVWYEDGNVVLIAERKAFKVHRSILSSSSDVFRDMFEVVQPDLLDSSSTFDGCPIVHLSDTAKELTTFLEILYSQGNHRYFRIEKVCAPMEWVSAVLRLGRKYQVSHIAEEAVRRLEFVCPPPGRNLMAYIWSRIDTYKGGGMAISIVKLARAYDLPGLLPFAFYMCCQLSIDKLIYGVELEDGSVDRLSLEDLARCLHGKEQIVARTVSLTQKLLHQSISPERFCKKRCFSNILVQPDIVQMSLSPGILTHDFQFVVSNRITISTDLPRIFQLE